MNTETQKRRPSGRTAIATIGVLGLAAATTFTLAQWTDEESVTGEITTGNFDLTVTPAALEYTEFAPDDAQVSEHILTNESSVDALVDLDILGFPAEGEAGQTDWDLTVNLDSAPDGFTAFTGDPAGGVEGVQLAGGPEGSQDLILAPDESVTVELVLELGGVDEGSQDITIENVEFAFNGTSETEATEG